MEGGVEGTAAEDFWAAGRMGVGDDSPVHPGLSGVSVLQPDSDWGQVASVSPSKPSLRTGSSPSWCSFWCCSHDVDVGISGTFQSNHWCQSTNRCRPGVLSMTQCGSGASLSCFSPVGWVRPLPPCITACERWHLAPPPVGGEQGGRGLELPGPSLGMLVSP